MYVEKVTIELSVQSYLVPSPHLPSTFLPHLLFTNTHFFLCLTFLEDLTLSLFLSLDLLDPLLTVVTDLL